MSTPRLRHAPVELRAEEGAPEGVLEGYASVYDVEYRIGWGLKESIAPGAFDRSIADSNGRMPIFYQHDWTNPIGYAEVASDVKGVKVRASLFMAENERARSVWLAAKAGALREWSIGFYPTKIELDSTDPDAEIEIVTEGDLAEASVVVRGANPATEMLDVRSRATDVLSKLRTIEARKRAEGSDADEDPGAVAQAIDALVDLAYDEASEEGIDQESLLAILTALDVVVDRLLVLLGVDDPGEGDDTADAVVPSYFMENSERPWVRELMREMVRKGAETGV